MINDSAKWLTDKPFAHRGLFDNKQIPENSAKAFQNAIDHGFGMEMDVQMTSDNVLVVFHDDNIKRMTGKDCDVREVTYDDIKDLTLLDTNEKIPLFVDFLKQVDGAVPLIIEIKTHKNIGVCEELVYNELKKYHGEFCIESFNPFIVRWFYVNAPEIIRGQLACDHKNSKLSCFNKYLLRNLKLCRWNRSQFVAYDANSIATVKAVRRYAKRVPIICWTIRSQQQFDQLKPCFDGAIFEGYLPEIK